MSVTLSRPSPTVPELPDRLPDHLELPEENGEFARNFRKFPQSMLLSSSIWPVLERLHPDRQFAVGQDCGIYWRISDPPEKGVIAPDWFYVSCVPPDLDGHYRRSYVLWQELIAPAVIIEYASGDGSVERDRTPKEGKFWIYEQAVRGGYYAIIVVETGELEVYRREGTRYRRLEPNERGHYAIEPLGVELGIWHGFFWNETAPWLRWYDTQGNLLPIGEERAEDEHRRAEDERQRADAQQRRAEQFAAKLRELGVDPSAIEADPAPG